jgi:hypothetical protein
MKLTGLGWKPDEIAKRCFNEHVLAICLVLQLLVWVLLAIAAFSIHWTIGVAIVCWIFLEPVRLLMQIRAASRTEEQPHHLATRPTRVTS